MLALNPLPTGNPVFQGGLGLMGIGVAGRALASGPKKLWQMATARLWITCISNDEDAGFPGLLHWLSLHLPDARASAYRLSTRWIDEGRGGGRDVTVLVPGPSERVLHYRGAKMWVTLGEDKEGVKRSYSVLIRCRTKHRSLLRSLVQEVAELEARPDPTITKIMRPGNHRDWECHATRPVRAAESIVLDGTEFERVLGDMRQFDAQYEWYMQLGIPYRRGYLLYGPPGNGKSSLCFALAGAVGRDLYVLPLGDDLMTDEKLVRLMGAVPARALVVMEDIDTVFHARDRKATNKLTLSALLNVLDGPLASEGRLVIMTSNHPEVLDPALVRPGRVDVRMELQNASRDQARRLLHRFHPGLHDADVERFAAWAGDGARSMAALQAHLVRTLGDPAAAITPQAVLEPVVHAQPPLPADDDDDDLFGGPAPDEDTYVVARHLRRRRKR